MSQGPLLATPDDLVALAGLHASAFDPAWTVRDLAPLFETPGAFGLWEPERGFVLCWRHGDEAEVLTIAVRPERRREGSGGRLMRAAMAAAASAGARSMLLEAAADNEPALRLYEGLGFMAVARRRNYYLRPGGRVDAVVMRVGLSTTCLDTWGASSHTGA